MLDNEQHHARRMPFEKHQSPARRRSPGTQEHSVRSSLRMYHRDKVKEDGAVPFAGDPVSLPQLWHKGL